LSALALSFSMRSFITDFIFLILLPITSQLFRNTKFSRFDFYERFSFPLSFLFFSHFSSQNASPKLNKKNKKKNRRRKTPWACSGTAYTKFSLVSGESFAVQSLHFDRFDLSSI
jgi:hypothetical protein